MSSDTLDPVLTTAIDQLEADNPAAALEILVGYQTDHPDDPAGYFYQGDALAELGRLDEAIAAYRKGLTLAPDDPDALTTLGDLQLEAGQHQDALQSYQRVLEVDPQDSDALVSIGLVYHAQDKADEAIAAFQQAL
ncbi:MAG: tetratricopeptide repeat protein, partial [Geobacter sp.]